MKKITLIVGARPNFMKAFPVYESLKSNFELTLIHTGQHFDEKMSKVFFDELGFPKPDIHFDLTSKLRAGDLDNKLYVQNREYLKNIKNVIDELVNYDGKKLGQLGEIRDKLYNHFEKSKPDMVIVFGDVTSTLSASLACRKLNVEIAHVESGLRSGDLSMPEEVNRILTDNMSSYFFVTEQAGVDNLKKEGITENVFLVGNTMIDTQKKHLDKALNTKYNEKIGVKKGDYVLITLHRPSNVDDIKKLREIFDDFFVLSKTEKLVYPIHPRTKTNLEKIGYLEKIRANKNIILDDPLGYLEFTCLIANCKYLITDSGGLQEESTALNIPCFTLRENTERPATLIENQGTNQMIRKISDIKLKKCKGNVEFWDGESNERIRKILKKYINKLKVAVGYAYSGKNIGGVRRYIENIEQLSKNKITLFPSYENDSIWRKNYNPAIRNNYRNEEIIKKQQEIIDNHDVFHSNVDPAWIKLCENAQKQGKLWIHTYHSIYNPKDESDGKLKNWQKEINDVQFEIAGKANIKISVGEWLVDECKKRNIDSMFIPNFINTGKLLKIKKDIFKKKYNLDNFILFSGDNSIRKNCVEFIKTATRLPQYKFVLIGTGLNKNEIELTYNIKISDNVIALGPLSHIECLEAINDCSILIINSFTEGLPTVLLEALYYQKPCIIPDGPDWSKYILNDINIGYKYPLGNIEKLSEKIIQIMKNYKVLPMAKKYIEDIYSSDVIINKLDNIYSLFLQKKNEYNIPFMKTNLNNILKNNDVHYKYKGINFLYKPRLKNKNLLILFHGAVEKKIKKPIFYGYNINPLLNNYDVLSFSDPLLDKYTNIELGWFLPTASLNTYEIIKDIINSIKNKYINVLCHGSSGGGFPSLLISSFFKFNCLICNSQIYLSKYWNYSFLKNNVKDLIEINIEDKLIDYGLPNKLYIFQNRNDEEHYNDHYIKLKLFLNNKFNENNIFYNEFTHDDIGKAIPWYPDIEQYKNNRPKSIKWDIDIDEKKYEKYSGFRREILGKNHNTPFPQECDKYNLFSSILNNEEIKKYKKEDFKKKLLISSLDNKFFVEIIELLKNNYNIKIDIYNENNEEKRENLLNWADIIFCEWCEINTLWYSKNKKSHQKLFVRLHRYELFTSFFYDIIWKNIDNIIFISPEIMNIANKHLIQKKYVNENNFDWEFYLKNNELLQENYNKIWAWNHFINYGNKMNWNRPIINLTNNINYLEICDEFKHFNGGRLIFNYVKSDMFLNLEKIEGNEFNIGILGILPRIKRLDIAVDIIEKLIKKDKRYKLYILGKWYTEWSGTSNNKTEIEYYKKLEKRINSCELKNNIVFDTFTSDVHIWFRKIGYILSVSDIEGSHQAVAEGMATGTIPIIYGKALKEYKLDKVYPSKYCFYDDNIDNLCNKIFFYSNNNNERKNISIECKKYSYDNFNIKIIYNKYIQLLQS